MIYFVANLSHFCFYSTTHLSTARYFRNILTESCCGEYSSSTGWTDAAPGTDPTSASDYCHLLYRRTNSSFISAENKREKQLLIGGYHGNGQGSDSAEDRAQTGVWPCWCCQQSSGIKWFVIKCCESISREVWSCFKDRKTEMSPCLIWFALFVFLTFWNL